MEEDQAGREERPPGGSLNQGSLARLIFPEYRFGKTPPDLALSLAEAGVGGFCFYGGTAEEVMDAARQLRNASPRPLLIAADYEDGAGRWVSGATRLPTNMAIGASCSEELARRKAEITALEARALGVDWVFAPVVDLASRPENPIVNVRSFGADPAPASRLAGAFLDGLASQRALACLKHFPGHGDTDTDSHLALPEIAAPREALYDRDLRPFRDLARRADSVMAGHLKLPELDPANPVSLSEAALEGLLRREMGYGGLVVTDALNMKALEGEGEPGVRAFLAGADALLFPEDPFRLLAALGEAARDGRISEARLNASLARLEALARRASSARSARPGPDVLRCAEHLAFPGEAAPRCLAWAYGGDRYRLKAGETVGYFEPLTPPAEWKGGAFAAELAALGVRVEPYAPGRGMKLAAGLFSGPRAYSGSINLSQAEKADLQKALLGAEASFVAAFGSPFVLKGLDPRPESALCAFCPLEEFQRAAARAAAGVRGISGVMPVEI